VIVVFSFVFVKVGPESLSRKEIGLVLVFNTHSYLAPSSVMISTMLLLLPLY